VASDAENCGECGHSCRGGTCLNGLCRPLLVASYEPPSFNPDARPRALVTDDTYLYWVEPVAGGAYTLQGVKKAGTNETPVALVEGLSYPKFARAFAEDGNVYLYGDDPNCGEVGCDALGGTQVVSPGYGGGGTLIDAALSSTKTALCYGGATVVFAAPDGSTLGPLADLPVAASAARVAANDTSFFVAGIADSPGVQSVWTFSKDAITLGATSPVAAAATQSGPEQVELSFLIADGDILFALGKASAELYRMDTAAQKLTTVAKTPGSIPTRVDPDWVAVDGSYVYWMTAGVGKAQLVRAPKTTGAPTVLHEIIGSVGSMTADDTSLYFSTAEGVWRLAK
jgi:hypothetical protein